MPRRRIRSTLLPLLLVLALGAGACAGDGEVGAPRIGGALAASVGSFEYTSGDLEDDVDRLADNPEFVSQAIGLPEVGEPGRRPADLVAFVLLFKIRAERGRQAAGETEGVEPPTDAQIDELVAGLDQGYLSADGQPLYQRFDDAFRRQFATDFAYFDFLRQVDPTTVDLPPVEVNPRYGTFVAGGDGLGTVLPPNGPAPQPFATQ